MSIVLYSTPGPAGPWLEALKRGLPDETVLGKDEMGDASEIEIVVAAGVPRGWLAGLPRLELVVGLLAGVEGILADPDLPEVPIVRCGAPDGDPMLSEFALLHVLRHHRDMPHFIAAQRRAEWSRLTPKAASERTVGVAGLGNIGLPAAELVRRVGFRVIGYARTPKSLPDFETFHGEGGFAPFLAQSEIVLNLLAATPATADMFGAEAFAAMPQGGSIINMGRGQHIVDGDLIAALDSSHLAHATLDVFREEPLPSDHPFWAHPKITVTPHATRSIQPVRLVPQIVENIRRLRAGETLLQLVDREAGY